MFALNGPKRKPKMLVFPTVLPAVSMLHPFLHFAFNLFFNLRWRTTVDYLQLQKNAAVIATGHTGATGCSVKKNTGFNCAKRTIFRPFDIPGAIAPRFVHWFVHGEHHLPGHRCLASREGYKKCKKEKLDKKTLIWYIDIAWRDCAWSKSTTTSITEKGKQHVRIFLIFWGAIAPKIFFIQQLC